MARTVKLETRLIIWVASLCLMQLLVFGGAVYALLSENVHAQTGQKALALANTLASRPTIRQQVTAGNISHELAAELDEIIALTGAAFIVIGDTQQIRLYHPTRERIGFRMTGEDSEQALFGERYVSTALGSLGLSIRGKAPIYNEQQQIVGLVSVGFLKVALEPLINEHGMQLLLLGLLLIAVSIVSAVWISHRVRNAIFGLQPEQIGRLFAEQEAIFNTVLSGVVAIDNDGSVRKYNQRAAEILNIAAEAKPQQLSLQTLLPEHSQYLLTNQHTPIRGFELFAAGKRIVMSRQVLQVKGQHNGILLSMRPVDEVEYLSQQLTKLQAFAELLRVQTHDYANKLNTLGALIQMQAYDKAIELIGQESQGFQAQIHQLLACISEPVIAGLLLGKHHKAREMNIHFEVTAESQLTALVRQDILEPLVSILGNLIDNALEASRNAIRYRQPKVLVTVDNVGNNLIFDVEDSGLGLATDLETIFTPQYSSKQGAQHGVGMYLVKTHLDVCGGTLEVGMSELGGARLTVYIPKYPSSHGVTNH